MKFADYFECFEILFASVILIVECEIKIILTVSLNFTAKNYGIIPASSGFGPLSFIGTFYQEVFTCNLCIKI